MAVECLRQDKMISNPMIKAKAEYFIGRIGVGWRKNPLTGNPTKCVVEQRLPNWQLKLNFGSYDTEPEAMIARDFGAFLRVSAGEDAATAGGYYADDHPSVYEFEESLAIFESLEDSKLRCAEFKELIPLYYQQTKEKWSGDANPPHKEFCKKARKDIAIAIGMFRERYPYKLVTSRRTETTKDLPIDKPLDGEIYSTPSSSNSEVRVSQSWKMPEFSSICSYFLENGRTSELEQIMSESAPEYNMMPRNGLINKEKFPSVTDRSDHFSSSPGSKLSHADRRYNPDIGDSMFHGQSPKKSRAKESSKHFGVRFRPDLAKWVAEIRVAEWKTVDKKVWLGTFDSEDGAARAVDAARKLLKCKKKRDPNFPCESLNAYLEKIPSNLNLTNLRDESMFKEVTLFVKRKAQEYAASFCPNKTACISISSDQVLAQYNSLQEPPQELALQEDNVSMASFGTSFGSSYNTGYNTPLPSCEGVITGDAGQWMSPTSVTYCSTPSCSSAGTSPEDRQWFFVDNSCYSYGQEMTQLEEQPVEGGWTAVHLAQSAESSHADNRGVWEGQNMGSDGQYALQPDQWLAEVNDFLFPNDDEFFEDQTVMDIVPRDEMLYVDGPSQAYSIGDPSLADWMLPLPQTTQVC